MVPWLPCANIGVDTKQTIATAAIPGKNTRVTAYLSNPRRNVLEFIRHPLAIYQLTDYPKALFDYRSGRAYTSLRQSESTDLSKLSFATRSNRDEGAPDLRQEMCWDRRGCRTDLVDPGGFEPT